MLLHLARKAFWPGKPPFPLLHVDTTWKFRDMIAFRDRTAREFGLDLIVHINRQGVERGINPFDYPPSIYTDVMKTQGLRQALDAHAFDAAFGGARRDEEASRAKERVFSFRSEGHRWDPRRQRPEMWRLLNGRLGPGETARIFPLSNWTEKDVWRYIAREQLDVVPLYFADLRPTIVRDGALLVLDDDRMPLRAGESRAAAPRPLPHARLLAADRGRDVRRRRSRQRGGRDADGAGVRAPGPPDRPRPVGRHGEEEAGGLFLMSAVATLASVEDRARPVRRCGRRPGCAQPRQERAVSLNVLTCGSVDDGKSTLIGRMLWDASGLHADQREHLEKQARTAAGTPDFSLLVDGLAAEREQGITIDIAWRYFDTPARRLVIIDSPGHEQYTRNMATGASHADIAILLVDARAASNRRRGGMRRSST